MRRLLGVAIADTALLTMCASIAWGAWRLTETRGLPGWLRITVFATVLLLGVGGYARSALPWWRTRLGQHRGRS